MRQKENNKKHKNDDLTEIIPNFWFYLSPVTLCHDNEGFLSLIFIQPYSAKAFIFLKEVASLSSPFSSILLLPKCISQSDLFTINASAKLLAPSLPIWLPHNTITCRVWLTLSTAARHFAPSSPILFQFRLRIRRVQLSARASVNFPSARVILLCLK